MSNPENDLLDARERLLQFVDDYDTSPETVTLNELWQRAKDLGKSASGSWLGYQANVYYRNFEPPPAGDHFDIENGTAGTYFSGPNPNWIEHSAQEVMDLLLGPDGNAALSSAEQKAEKGLELLKSIRADVLSVMTVYLADHDDSFVRRLIDEIEKAKVVDAADIANEMSPKRQMLTRDMRAAQQGTWAPPHIKVQARVTAQGICVLRNKGHGHRRISRCRHA